MNDWSTVFLGIIAVATLATAVIQIAVLIAAGMLTKRLGRLADQVERELTPLLASLNGYSPALAVEFGRKVLYSTERPSFTELEVHVKQKK